jgi:thioredoxin reductase (NADPH)
VSSSQAAGAGAVERLPYLLGGEPSRDIRPVASFVARNRVPFRAIALGDEKAAKRLHASGLKEGPPAVIFGRDRVIDPPAPRAVAQVLRHHLAAVSGKMFDVVIVGGGPAGMAAADYAGAKGGRRA